jgi:hypothetical protein
MRTLTTDDMKSAAMGEVKAGFASNATASARTSACAAIARLHEMNLKATKSLTYDPTLGPFGRNVKKDVRIGPSAFSRTIGWLGCVVYHELIHSDQFDIYAAQGVELPAGEPSNETERRLVALDEAEAFYRTWEQRETFRLTTDETQLVWRRVIDKLIDVDEDVAQGLAKKKRFADARLSLIKSLKKP